MTQSLPIFTSVCTFVVAMVLLTGCDEAILQFPDLLPASVRVLNATDNADTLGIIIDSVTSVSIRRTELTDPISIAAGRRVPFVFTYKGLPIGRDTAQFTLGANGRIMLIARGSKDRIIRFLPPVLDTILPSGTANAFIKFTHAVEHDNVSRFYSVQLWRSGSTTEQLLPQNFDPDQTSRSWHALAPGQYTFEVRARNTSDVAATLGPIALVAGKSYFVFTTDIDPPALDRVALSIR